MRIWWSSLLGLVALAGCEAGQGGAPHDYPEMNSRAFNVFARQCAQCHAPPMPDRHTAAEWPGVIARMQRHRIQRSLPPIDAADMAEIRAYLTRHAKPEGEKG